MTSELNPRCRPGSLPTGDEANCDKLPLGERTAGEVCAAGRLTAYLEQTQSLPPSMLHRFHPAGPLSRITSAIEWPHFALASFDQPVAAVNARRFRPEIA